MRVALYDVDSAIPNLALMRLSAWHAHQGDAVEWYAPLWRTHYDRIYASTLFQDSDKSGLEADQMTIGGTGWNLTTTLPPAVEAMPPDYTIYRYPHNIGFSQRGCRFACKFCVVPQKEGRPKAVNTIPELWTQRSSPFLVLLDNDFFGQPVWQDRCAELLALELDVNFCQGLNIRLITEEQARLLARLRFWNLRHTKRQVYFAWDRFQDEARIDAGIQRVLAAGIKPWQMAFYVLIGFDTTPEQDLYRVTKLRNYGCDPFVMPYTKTDPYQRHFARWVNHKALFASVAWQEYFYEQTQTRLARQERDTACPR